MSENMVERVAAAIMRALASDSLQHVERERHGGETVIDGRFDLSAVARAAIEAMAEPTNEMCFAGGEAETMFNDRDSCEIGYQTARDAWHLMLTAALKP